MEKESTRQNQFVGTPRAWDRPPRLGTDPQAWDQPPRAWDPLGLGPPGLGTPLNLGPPGLATPWARDPPGLGPPGVGAQGLQKPPRLWILPDYGSHATLWCLDQRLVIKVLAGASYYLILERGLRLAGPR